MITKESMTIDDLVALMVNTLASKEDLKNIEDKMATKDDLQNVKQELKADIGELREDVYDVQNHLSVIEESFSMPTELRFRSRKRPLKPSQN